MKIIEAIQEAYGPEFTTLEDAINWWSGPRAWREDFTAVLISRSGKRPYLAVFKLGGVQFNLVGFPDKNRPPTAFGMNAAVPDDFPFFTVQIFDPVGIIATTGMLGAGVK